MRYAVPFLGLFLPGALAKLKPICTDVSFAVSATGQNVLFASPPDPDNTTAILEFMRSVWSGNIPASNGTLPISGTFTIKGTYCVPSRAQLAYTTAKGTLQVLIHGAMYNKTMWAGFGFDPSSYSWHVQATARGYATLALDRLGHGDNPQHPDPLSVVQPQLQVEILHQIMAAVRSSGSKPAPPLSGVLGHTYDKVVLVGHSLGSLVGAALAAQYPADATALVLTGYSNYRNFSSIITAEWVSASDFRPERFGAGLAKGYLTMAREEQRTAALYVGGYDAAIPPVDFAYEDTLTVGEIGGLAAILPPAAGYVGYVGHVLVVTPVEDAFFCGADEALAEKCEEQLNATAQSFPDAKSYNYFAPKNTGHDLTLHYSAPETLKRVHDWLDAKL